LRAEYEKQRAADGFTIGAHLSCLKASAAAYAAYGPGFKELNEEQKYNVWNAPYTAAATGENAGDIIAKLRSVYQKGRADKVVAPAADTKDEAPGLATLIVLAGAAAGAAAGGAAGGAAAGGAAAGGAAGGAAAGAPAAGAPAAGAPAAGAPAAVKQKKRKPQFSPNPNEDPTTSQEETDDDMGLPTRISNDVKGGTKGRKKK